MFDEDTPIGRIARYIARSRLGVELSVRIRPIKQGLEPHYRRSLVFYKQHCAPLILRTRDFIQRKTKEYKKYREDQRQLAKEQAGRDAEATRIQEAELEAERAAAARDAFDPEGAIEDMRLAHSYLEDWLTNKGDHVLGLAAQYIESARTKDPNAKLATEIKKGENKGEVLTYTLNELAGTTLFYQSQLHSYTDAPRKDLVRARNLLTRAIAYDPYTVQFRRHLVDVHLNLHNKQRALAVAGEALASDPKNLDARKLLDHVQNAPETSPPNPLQGKGAIICFSIDLFLLILAIWQLFRGEFSNFLSLIVFALIFAGVGKYLDSDEMLKKAFENEARKNKSG